MADDIPFNKSFDLKVGQVAEVAPGVRALVCGNPGPFTFHGTMSYILGRGTVAIVDPGPDDPAHLAALLEAVRGETVSHILITHTHRDHSPGAAAVKAATGALTIAEGAHRAARPVSIGELNPLDSAGDRDFVPDVTVRDGDSFSVAGLRIDAVATPGHTANHMAYAVPDNDLIFCGDHVMGWATSIVAPPDGAMSDYMASLERIGRRPERTYLAGHGAPIPDAPAFVQHYIAHRKAREASILHRLGKGEADIPTLVRAIYIGLDPRLAGAAGLSVLAHLEDLATRGEIIADGPVSLVARYRLS